MLFQDFVVKTCGLDLFGHFTHAGHHAHHALHAAHFKHLLELHFQVVHVELTFGHALHHALGLFGLDGFLGFFNKADDVAHAKDAAGDAFWFERLDCVELFAKANEFDRLAGDSAHGQCRTTAPVAVHSGQDHAGDADAFVEIFCSVDRVLTGQAVDNQ